VIHLLVFISSEEMKTRSGKPKFTNKASAAERCHVIVEEVENNVG
jgi:hypothetical protein